MWDSDGDGFADAQELALFASLDETLLTDFDGDGLRNGIELRVLGSDPTLEDTNNDGIRDDVAYGLGLQPGGRTTSGEFDSDGDGLSDSDEIAQGTNPYLRDTDGDELPDNLDPLPLDPSWNSPTAPPDILGAPVIILLISPPAATPQP
jgi:hypothetical protein